MKNNEVFNFKFFKKFNVDEILELCNQFTDEWLLDTSRQSKIYKERRNPHTDTETYILNDHELSWRLGEKFNPKFISNNNKVLESVKPIVNELESHIGGKVARILFIKLKAGGIVNKHVDSGDYLGTVRRFHIPIITNEEVIYNVGGEFNLMKYGECWEINNFKEHFVENKSDEDRIHLLIDIMPNWAIIN